MAVLSLEGYYKDCDELIPFQLEISPPLWSDKLLVYQCMIESEEMFSHPMTSAGMTPSEEIASALELVKIILQYRLSELYQLDKNDLS
jgi:hypothetical protein